ncbi:MAG: DUF2281 domain-containing protein [Aphanocapsa sp. GSE-SYN-MK-11-07L]|jgi:hypothetical protein|nr:DUF2281 domain-containing protein [Aphanocapsa sp. GSE-SYN-MK-11-07L]
MIHPTILEKLEKLPESLQTEVLHYIEFLLEKQATRPLQSETSKKRRLAGSMKGTFVLPLPDNFDEPLELTNAAACTEYEKKYGYGSLAGKIVISDDFDEPLKDLKDYM